MFFDCPSATSIWTRLTKILHKLLDPQPLHKKHILLKATGYTKTYWDDSKKEGFYSPKQV
jgi:hypothetical protein